MAEQRMFAKNVAPRQPGGLRRIPSPRPATSVRDRRRRAEAAEPDTGYLLLGALRLCLFVLDTLVFIPIVLLASIGDPEGRRAYAVARWWARFNVWCCGVRVEVKGLEHLEPSKSYVFMANHRSAFDIVTLLLALRDSQLRWVTKAELGRIPGFGWCLHAMKQIFVDRRNHERAVASLAAARSRIRDGVSVVFFPEGTRSAGAMLPFKKGGFVFAIETAIPIVPIGIRGPRSLLDRTGLLCRRRGVVRVEVHRPITTADLTLADRDRLLARVRWAIAAAAAPAQPPPRGRARIAATPSPAPARSDQ